ncbi:MAG TPA: glycosyltransferase family 4 protein [Solirubrobacterales bacterium]|jgi:glycosyltransferase involved in cell wall biosynthesis|nr:glycosyltransferase family 4 protein [Solirubrobacterales bacterium]
MKILISTDTVGGVLTYTAELAAALEAAGDEVVVATMGPRLRRAQRGALPARVHESGFRLEWMEDPWNDVEAAAGWLLQLEEEEQPDVVHLCSYAHGALPFRAPRVLVAHSCVLSWWRAVHGTPAPTTWNRYREETFAGLDAADAVVAPTAATLQKLERDRPLDPERAHVIHNGSATPPAPRATHSELHRDGRPFVLGSGRFWDAAKNLAALDTAAEGLEWPVVVAGDLGDDPPPRHARATGVLDREALTGLRRTAPIYAAPAVYEPFGLGILEAARDRCALVLGDIPSLRELWSDAALFVDPRDPDLLRATLQGLIEDRLLREDLAERAQRRSAAYSMGRAMSAYRNLYQRLLAPTRTREDA